MLDGDPKGLQPGKRTASSTAPPPPLLLATSHHHHLTSSHLHLSSSPPPPSRQVIIAGPAASVQVADALIDELLHEQRRVEVLVKFDPEQKGTLQLGITPLLTSLMPRLLDTSPS